MTLEAAIADGEQTAYIQLEDGPEDGAVASCKDVIGSMVFRESD